MRLRGCKAEDSSQVGNTLLLKKPLTNLHELAVTYSTGACLAAFSGLMVWLSCPKLGTAMQVHPGCLVSLSRAL